MTTPSPSPAPGSGPSPADGSGLSRADGAGLRSINTWGAHLVDHGLAASIVLAAASTAIAVSVYTRPVTKPVLLLPIGLSLALCFWPITRGRRPDRGSPRLQSGSPPLR